MQSASYKKLLFTLVNFLLQKKLATFIQGRSKALGGFCLSGGAHRTSGGSYQMTGGLLFAYQTSVLWVRREKEASMPCRHGIDTDCGRSRKRRAESHCFPP